MNRSTSATPYRLEIQKRQRRVERQTPANYTIGEQEYDGLVADLSEGGCRVQARLAPPVGEEIHLKMRLDTARWMYCDGVVRWSKRGVGIPSQFGLSFINPAERVRGLLDVPVQSGHTLTLLLNGREQVQLFCDRDLKSGPVLVEVKGLVHPKEETTVELRFHHTRQSLEFPVRILEVLPSGDKAWVHFKNPQAVRRLAAHFT